MVRLYLPLAAATLASSCAAHRSTASLRPPTHTQPAMERQIRNARDAGDGDYALQLLRQRVVVEPGNPDVRLELVQAYRDHGQPDLALEHARLAASRFPESGAAQLSLARALRDTRQQQDALAGLEAFLQQHPQTSSNYTAWLGILRDDLKQLPAGEEAHRAALAIGPESDFLHNNLGYNLSLQGRSAEAAAQFRDALRLNPRSEVARNNLALTLAGSGATAEALRTWQTTSDPASAHSNLAAVMIEKGDYGEARKEIDQALGYNKQHPAAWKNLELVSRLDGKPATLTSRQPGASRWDRFRSSFLKLWVGPLDTPAGKQNVGPGD